MDAIVALALERTEQGEFYPVVWRDYKKAKRPYQKSDLPILARVDVRMEGDWKDGAGRVQFRKPGEDWTPWEDVNLYSAVSGLGLDIRWDTEVSGDGMKALRAWLSGEGDYEAVATFLRAQKRRDMEDEAQAAAALKERKAAARNRIKKETDTAMKSAQRVRSQYLPGWTLTRPPEPCFPGTIHVTFSKDGTSIRMPFPGGFWRQPPVLKRYVFVKMPDGVRFPAPFKDALELIKAVTTRTQMLECARLATSGQLNRGANEIIRAIITDTVSADKMYLFKENLRRMCDALDESAVAL